MSFAEIVTYWFAWGFFLSEWAIRLVMLVVVPFRRTPAAAKGWLLLIFFEPWIGLLLYALIGRPAMPRSRVEQMARLPQVMAKVRERVLNHPNVFHPELSPGLEWTGYLAQKLGRMPALGGNAVEIMVDYDAILARLVADIDQARNHVHLLYYIFVDDTATAPVIAALGRAAGRGVTCRVLVDALGYRTALRILIPKLTALGVDVKEMLPVGLFDRKRARLDLRNHRKIAIVDGRVAYTGSQNLIAADFIAGITYEELVLHLTGPAVLELQYIFAADWFLERFSWSRNRRTNSRSSLGEWTGFSHPEQPAFHRCPDPRRPQTDQDHHAVFHPGRADAPGPANRCAPRRGCPPRPFRNRGSNPRVAGPAVIL
jgi:cardiolipin synthase A/B